MYESIKEQRKKFVKNLRASVSKYKSNMLSDNPENLDTNMLKQDWESVGAYIKDNISIGIYDDLVKKLSNNLQDVAKKATKEEYENEK